jgi:hypothetical protein
MQKEAEDKRAAIRKEVEAEVAQMPIFAAMRS